MNEAEFADVLGPAFANALKKKGFTSLTAVQARVLDPALAGRDLRITSQTGSGKTVAIGLAVRDLIEQSVDAPPNKATPSVLVVAPTRELAKQVEEELSWLYAGVGARVVGVTGGASVRDELRALSREPRIVVGTPGRLLDHLKRKAIHPELIGAVALDEADRMLDLGFKEDLEAILAFAPEGHRTHLVSATFPRGVLSLANAVQNNPAHVEGTPLGSANSDIEHVIHLVDAKDRVAAIINLLLARPGEQTLIFARTRADVAHLTRDLSQAGFHVHSLSGEMEQGERNRALAKFKSGGLDALIATDVAARGIDVQDIARVIHAEPPTDPDTYTHRSGRTGRAGKKGTSALLVAPSTLAKTTSLLKRARVRHRFEPIPTSDQIRQSRTDRLVAELTADDPEGFSGYDDAFWALAKRLSEAENIPRTIARLLTNSRLLGVTEPRPVRAIFAPDERVGRNSMSMRPGREPSESFRSNDRIPAPPRAPRERSPRTASPAGGWVPFRVSWGQEHGADPRRLLAMLCRRGEIQSSAVGAIRIARAYSVVDVSAEVAESFERGTSVPDPRNPRVHVRREIAGSIPPPSRAPSEDDHRAPARSPEHHRPPRPEARQAPRPERPEGRPSRPNARPARPDSRASAPAHSRPSANRDGERKKKHSRPAPMPERGLRRPKRG